MACGFKPLVIHTGRWFAWLRGCGHWIGGLARGEGKGHTSPTSPSFDQSARHVPRLVLGRGAELVCYVEASYLRPEAIFREQFSCALEPKKFSQPQARPACILGHYEISPGKICSHLSQPGSPPRLWLGKLRGGIWCSSTTPRGGLVALNVITSATWKVTLQAVVVPSYNQVGLFFWNRGPQDRGFANPINTLIKID